ncbi:hypothetical protein, partial [Salmonella enterica]|uniref:hypothetical protein n=1 Tax=Salmonella enterica TaxID=28901 RepID=UPI0020C30DC3
LKPKNNHIKCKNHNLTDEKTTTQRNQVLLPPRPPFTQIPPKKIQNRKKGKHNQVENLKHQQHKSGKT